MAESKMVTVSTYPNYSVRYIIAIPRIILN